MSLWEGNSTRSKVNRLPSLWKQMRRMIHPRTMSAMPNRERAETWTSGVAAFGTGHTRRLSDTFVLGGMGKTLWRVMKKSNSPRVKSQTKGFCVYVKRSVHQYLWLRETQLAYLHHPRCVPYIPWMAGIKSAFRGCFIGWSCGKLVAY